MKMRAIAACRTLAACIGLAACGGGEGPASPAPPGGTTELTALAVTTRSPTLIVGDTMSAVVTGTTTSGASVTIANATWQVSSPVIASVGSSGIITALGEGRVTLTARARGREASVTIDVTPLPVARLELSVTHDTIAPTTTRSLFAYTYDRGGGVISGRPITWSTSDSTRAIVAPDGFLTAVAEGVAIITATSEGVRTTATITVSSPVHNVARLTLSSLGGSLIVGDTLQLSATLLNALGDTLKTFPVQWTSTVVRAPQGANLAPVVEVTSKGAATAVSEGTAIVEARADGVFATATFVVTRPVDPTIVVTVVEPGLNAVIGDTVRVGATVDAPRPIVGAVLTVGRLIVPLEFTMVGKTGGWAARVDVIDLVAGPYLLLVTATDAQGAIGRGSLLVTRDARRDKGGSSIPPRSK